MQLIPRQTQDVVWTSGENLRVNGYGRVAAAAAAAAAAVAIPDISD